MRRSRLKRIRCYGCFDEFMPKSPNMRYCSRTCIAQVKWEKQEARLLDIGATDRQLEMHRRGHPKYRMRRVLMGSDALDIRSYTKCMAELRNERIREGQIDDIDLDELIKRDKGKCYICGGKTGNRVKHGKGGRGGKGIPRADYPTVDHVIPISRGGTHTWDNVKLAHQSCNSKKGGKLI